MSAGDGGGAAARRTRRAWAGLLAGLLAGLAVGWVFRTWSGGLATALLLGGLLAHRAGRGA